MTQTTHQQARADDPVAMPICRMVEKFANGSLSPVEVAETALTRIETSDTALHAYTWVDRKQVLASASEAERRLRSGDRAPLLGVPISIKDVFHVAGQPTSFGSVPFRGIRSMRDSQVPGALRRAGAIFIGKANTAEFGQSATTDNMLGPDTANPWDLSRTPGGSSGGAAASVVAGTASAAVGSDGGGSIRIPAALTGLVGLKPTHGARVADTAMRSMSRFSSPGPLARTTGDARLLLGALQDQELFRQATAQPLRILFDATPGDAATHPGILAAVNAAATALTSLGHHVVEAALPINGWLEAFGPLVIEEEHRERAPLLALAGDQLSRYEAATIKAGRRLRPEAVAIAEEAHRRYRARFTQLLTEFDVILSPTTAVPAFTLGERPREISGRPVDPVWGAFPFTAPFNVAGVPALSLPWGTVDGLPVGVQLAMAHGADARLLDLGEDLEEGRGPSDLLQRGGFLPIESR